MGNKFDTPYGLEPVVETTGEQGRTKGFVYGIASMQGWRKKQEDTYTVIPEFCKDYSYFAVFDGHGGSEVAKYLKRHLHYYVDNELRTKVPPHDPELALHLAFLACDAHLRDPMAIAELKHFKEDEKRAKNIKAEQVPAFVMSTERAGNSARAVSTTREESTEGQGSTQGQESTEGQESSADLCIDVAFCTREIIESNIMKNIKAEQVPAFVMSTERDGNSARVISTTREESTEGQGSTGGQQSSADLSINVAFCTREIKESNINKEEKVTDPLFYLLKANRKESDPEGEEEVQSSDSSPEVKESDDSQPGVNSGSTATVLLIAKRKFYCANVGDSRCVLCRAGNAIDLSIDHKPEDSDESERIIASGAEISDGRINKTLNLSRAFGDFAFKDPSLPPSRQCIIVEPSITKVQRSNEDEFIVIASDGLWNSMSSQEVIDYVKIRLQDERNLRTIAEDLFRLVLAPDTSGDGTGCDNMTCIIILLTATIK